MIQVEMVQVISMNSPLTSEVLLVFMPAKGLLILKRLLNGFNNSGLAITLPLKNIHSWKKNVESK